MVMKSVISCILFMLFFYQIKAQEEVPYVFRFSLFSMNEVEENLYYLENETFHPIGIITSRNKTKHFNYKSKEAIRFYLKGNDVEDPWIPLSSSIDKMNKSWRDVYFILSPKEWDGADIQFIRVDESIFPYGSYYLMNITDLKMGFIFDGKKLFLESKESLIVNPDFNKAKQIGVQFFCDEPQLIRRINAKWFYRPNTRKVIFIKSVGAGANVIRTHSISDFKAAK